MRDEGVIYVAGHPLLNIRCTRLPGCRPIRLRNDLYCVEWGVKLYSLTHSLTHLLPTRCSQNQRIIFLFDSLYHVDPDEGEPFTIFIYSIILYLFINCFINRHKVVTILPGRNFRGAVTSQRWPKPSSVGYSLHLPTTRWPG